MKTIVCVFGLLAALTFCTTAYASPITFNVNGTLQGGGTFSGFYTLDPSLDEITGGEITVTEFDGSAVLDFNHAHSYGSTTLGDFQGPTPSGVGLNSIFYFDTTSSITSPAIYYPGTSYIVYTDPGNGPSYSVTAGTISTISQTPEPSSLILLATGALGVTAVARRRRIRTSNSV